MFTIRSRSHFRLTIFAQLVHEDVLPKVSTENVSVSESRVLPNLNINIDLDHLGSRK